jgi:hypothetical protein
MIIQTDRPSQGVSRLLASDLPDCVSDCQHLPYPLLGPRGARWTDSINDGLDLAERGEPFDWVFQADDDRWIEPHQGYQHLVPALNNSRATVFNFESLFFFGNSNTFTTTRHHFSALMFRHSRGARLSGRRVVSVPDEILDAAHIRDTLRNFPVPLLDYGSATPAEAHRVTAAYLAAGISDAYTQSALLPPNLRIFSQQHDSEYGKWIDRAAEFGLLTPLT